MNAASRTEPSRTCSTLVVRSLGLDNHVVLDHRFVDDRDLFQYLKAADVWSRKAIKLVDNQETRINRGAILVEIGKYQAGKQMLLPFTNSDKKTKIVGFCSCYIAKAEYLMGDVDIGIKWLMKAKDIGVVNHLVERIGEDINLII